MKSDEFRTRFKRDMQKISKWKINLTQMKIAQSGDEKRLPSNYRVEQIKRLAEK